MQVSIIIPVYNVAIYVEKCIDSVMAQTYTDIECIIVDDCGTDHSMKLVQDILNSYRGPIDFKVLRHDRNRGLSAARNTGTAAATGDYVYYLDSDDVITADCIELLARPASESRPDFVVGGYRIEGLSVGSPPALQLGAGLISTNEKILNAFVTGRWYPMAVNKLLRREFLLSHKLYFKEGLIHEDMLWSFLVACKAGSMAVVEKSTYAYFMRAGSLTVKKSTRNLESILVIAAEMLSYIRRHNIKSPAVVDYVLRYLEYLPLHFEAMVREGIDLDAPLGFYRKRIRPLVPISLKRFQGKSLPEKVFYLQYFLPASVGYFFNSLYCCSKRKFSKAKPQS